MDILYSIIISFLVFCWINSFNMATRKDIEYMENEIKKNTKLSHDIYCCLIESIDNYYDNDIKKPIVSLDKSTIKIFYLIKGIVDNDYNK